MDQKIKHLNSIDCACVIYGDSYDWGYVNKLYNMLTRHLSPRVTMHVFTEAQRMVPKPFVKHALPKLDISDSKRFWWYKIMMFDPANHAGPLLYFDLDTVIVNNIDWIWQNSTNYFWAIRDFKALWRPLHNGVNTSVMWWDTTKFDNVWTEFNKKSLTEIMRAYHGDQDFVSDCVSDNMRRFLDPARIKSWRWQSLDGGYDFKNRMYKQPGIGTNLEHTDTVLVFHGKPKPAEVLDPLILTHWR